MASGASASTVGFPERRFIFPMSIINVQLNTHRNYYLAATFLSSPVNISGDDHSLAVSSPGGVRLTPRSRRQKEQKEEYLRAAARVDAWDRLFELGHIQRDGFVAPEHRAEVIARMVALEQVGGHRTPRVGAGRSSNSP